MKQLYLLITFLILTSSAGLHAQDPDIFAEIQDPAGHVYRGNFVPVFIDNEHTFYDFAPILGMGMFWDGQEWTIAVDGYDNVYFQSGINTDTPVPPSLAAGNWRTVLDGWKLIALSESGAPLGLNLTVSQPVSCAGGLNAIVRAAAEGGSTIYTFSWSTGAVTTGTTSQINTITGLPAGAYSVTVTDSDNVVVSGSVTVEEPTVLSVTPSSQTNVACNGEASGIASINVSGGTPEYTYLWSDGAVTASNSNLPAGTHAVTVTDANGCSAETSFTITEPTALSVMPASQTNIACNGAATGSASVNAEGGTPGYTYLWSTGATTATATNLEAGGYTVTVTDGNGCSGTASFTLTQPTVLTVSAEVDAVVSCNGLSDGGATVSAAGGSAPYTYTWSNAATTASITGVAAGTYSVTVTDANGCTATNSATITQPAPLNVAGVVNVNVKCNGGNEGAATATVTGGNAPYTYRWSNGVTTARLAGLIAGTYDLTVTDAGGCTAFSSVTITEPDVLVAAVSVDANVSCNAGSSGAATVSTTGGTAPYTYLWSNGAETESIAGLAAGTYSVTVTDARACTAAATLTVTEPTVLTATAEATAMVICKGLPTGEASVTVSGGTAPYAYGWSTGSTAAALTSLTAGTYTVIVTDANGCTASSMVTITEPEALVASGVVDANVTCNGGAEGAATATVTGGTAPYRYEWSNGARTASLSGLTAGTYEVTVTDDGGCVAVSSVTVTETSSIELDLSSTEDSGDADGSVMVIASGGTAPYSYAWNTDPVQTTATVTGLPAGTYEVAATDANGCVAVSSITVRLSLAGDDCASAPLIDDLFGLDINTTITSAFTDNAGYLGDTVFLDDLDICFSETDTLYHPVYYRFLGDGKTYRVRTSTSGALNPLANGDTRGALFSGACGELTLLACNDDESDERLNMMLEFSTEAGTEYTLLVDGATAASGAFALEVSQITSTAVTPIRQASISIYPNPTSGRITLDGITARSVDVYDAFGRRVATHANPGTAVDLQQLPAGVYYLRIADAQQGTYSARVVKQ